MQAARISVITPTRNRLAFLREAVASVEAQSFAEWEMVVVDDASEDDTWDWLQSLDDQRIRTLRMPQRRERSAARNAGLRAANGEYVVFLDDDDWLLDGALERLARALQSHPDAIAAVGARFAVGPDAIHRSPHPHRRHLRSTWQDALFGWVPGNGQVLLRRSAVLKAGGWSERLRIAEDHDLWLRLGSLGPVLLIPQAVLGYRLHAGQTVKAGALSRTLALRRTLLNGFEQGKLSRARGTVQAMRQSRLAARSFARSRYADACRRCLLATRQAPWLLKSPLSRPVIVGLALRSAAGLAFGERVVRILHRVKRTLENIPKKTLEKSFTIPRQPGNLAARGALTDESRASRE